VKGFEEVAEGLWRFALAPADLASVYLLGDVLVDAGGRFAPGKLLRALEPHEVRAHAVTHAHFDHQGGSRKICDSLKIPAWCGEGDREAMETGDLSLVVPNPDTPFAKLHQALAGPACPIERSLKNGDVVGGFEVVETPGHTPGHLAYWRESDRALVLGDVLFHKNPVTLRTGLQEPFTFATHDRRLNRESARRLAELEPSLICFGHGAPLRDTQLFVDFVAGLPNS
jgi:glyoxylase-like metal-dependent hydrolase (beta-lactamase superfamily II)